MCEMNFYRLPNLTNFNSKVDDHKSQKYIILNFKTRYFVGECRAHGKYNITVDASNGIADNNVIINHAPATSARHGYKCGGSK